jgi:hypothetical protein
MLFQIHRSVRAERNAFRFQKGTLGSGGINVKAAFGSAESIHDPMTGNRGIFAACHGISNGSGTAGHPGQTRNLTVSCNASGWNSADDVIKCGENPTAHRSDTS